MARMIQQIYDKMIAEKQSFANLSGLQPDVDNAQRLLDDLTTASKVAVWRLMFWVVAVAVWVHEGIVEEKEAAINDIILRNHYGTIPWWNARALEFQKGDGLVVTDGRIGYAVTDVEKQIVKYAAAVAGDYIKIKVAGIDNDELNKIDVEDVPLVQEYVNQIKPAGTRIIVTSEDADLLQVTMTVYVNALKLRTNGSMVSDSQQKPVETAINSYLKGIEFDGKMRVSKLVDAVQAVDGVVDVAGVDVKATYGSTPTETVTREYLSYAGWMRIDTTYPLSATITYVAQ